MLGLFRQVKKNFNWLLSGSRNEQIDFPAYYSNHTNIEYYNVYNTVAPVSDAINKIINQINTIEVKAFDVKRKKFIEHPIVEFLKKPNQFCSYNDFMSHLVINYLVTGNSFFTVLSPAIDAEPIDINIFNTLDVNIKKDENDGYVDFYEVLVNGSIKNKFFRVETDRNIIYVTDNNLSEIYHIKHPGGNTTNWRLGGVSPLSNVMYEIYLYLAGTIFNKSILENQGRPCGILSPKNLPEGIDLTNDQLSRIAKDFDSAFKGTKNAGRNIFLSSEFDYKQLSLTAKDMEYNALITSTKNSIYRNFNIPLALIESTSLSMSNVTISRPMFFENAVFPVFDKILHNLTTALMRRYKNSENVILTYDKKEVDGVFDLQIERLKNIASLNVLSSNELRAHLNLKPVNGGDDILVPNTMVPIAFLDEFLEENASNTNTD